MGLGVWGLGLRGLDGFRAQGEDGFTVWGLGCSLGLRV